MENFWKQTSTRYVSGYPCFIFLFFKENAVCKTSAPGDSKWPFHPLIGGHLPFQRVTETDHPKKVTNSQHCQACFLKSFLCHLAPFPRSFCYPGDGLESMSHRTVRLDFPGGNAFLERYRDLAQTGHADSGPPWNTWFFTVFFSKPGADCRNITAMRWFYEPSWGFFIQIW